MTTVLITGANRGLGLEFARQYRANGADVIACCRAPAKADLLNALAVKVLELDVTDSASINTLAAALKGTPIDILIASAGIWGPERQGADDCDFDRILEVLTVNSVGPWRVARALKANLVAGYDKKLVVITSKMGSISDSSGGSIAYRASKAALNMIMHAVAKEWARDGLKVGIFHPGWVQTDMGGPQAPLDAEASINGLCARIAELSTRTSGRFIDYAGKEIGW
jgi:NAD(P)-dependent dehydrogenase (short-subunit alcohol dehydrogenase family)